MLRASKTQTAVALAHKLGVTVRTVYRDIDALIATGLPVRGVPGPSGGYELAEHYPVDPFVYVQADPPPSLAQHSSDVGRALQSATMLLSDALPEPERDLIRRLRERFLFDTSAWLWQDTRLDCYRSLKHAVLHDERIELVYAERGNADIKTDIVDAYGLVWRQGHWYLIAHSNSDNAFVRYRLARILAVRPTGTTFVRRPDFALLRTWTQLLDRFGRGGQLVRLRIDSPATHDFESFAWKRGQKITKCEDHWIVEMKVDANDWLVPLVLSFGGLVRVLEPASLRDRVTDALKSALAAHRATQSLQSGIEGQRPACDGNHD